ncbi:MAG: GNAT family N-acetyltransferase [bacterium]|nr:GNAT family N-acetyltransferase [bacterium]
MGREGPLDVRLERCRLRRWRAGDEDSLAKHADDRGVWINLRDRFPHPFRTEDAVEWVRASLGVSPPNQLAIEVDGEAAGGIGISPDADVHRFSAEIGFWLGRAHWGRGIMTEALRAAVDHAFSEFELARLYAATFEWNGGSRCVLERNGFVCEGRMRRSVFKDGRFADQFLYALLKEEHGA